MGFKIGGDEEVGLFDAEGNLVDSADWDEGESPESGSLSRIPDGTGDFKTVFSPTPGEPNRDEGDMPPEPECGNEVCEEGEDEESCLVDCGPPETGLVINEVAAAGDPDDWFELYNGNNSDIDLTGFTITDDIAGEPDKATFEEGTNIAARAYLVVFMTDEFPGFRLGGDEELAIYDPDVELVDSVDWDEGDSPAGGSFARAPDGTGDFETLMPGTPGEPND